MRVLLVTTWDQACGIAEHSYYLRKAVQAADPSIEIFPLSQALDPHFLSELGGYDLIHLNYHGALHSRWTVTEICAMRQRGIPVVVTYHDTGVPNSEQAKAICAAADAFVVHEPYDDLEGNGHYWRMGVPDWPRGIFQLDTSYSSWCGSRPILGSIGFPFPWKNFDLLAKITAELGWAFLLIAPGATADYVEGLQAINPHSEIVSVFVHRDRALACLHECDATAFPYVCHNTGQSAAILQGVAARKPVHAFATCRQFRALFGDRLGRTAITWAENVEDLTFHLSHFSPLGRVSPPMVALAEQDSWARLGMRYAELYKEVAGG